MIIVFGTPRSGTTYFTRWISNNNPNYKYLGEYFQPYFFDTENPEEEITNRLKKLPLHSIIKIHPGPELDHRVLTILKNNPVNLVIRKDKLSQIVSMGLASISDTWVTYNTTNTYTAGKYKKEWFDDITTRIEMFNSISPSLNIVNKFYYEDIDLYKKNGKLPIKQNKYSLEESLKLFSNKEELLGWYYDWIK